MTNDHPLARRTDPATSHEAGQAIRSELPSEKARALRYVTTFPDQTAVELAEIAGDRDVRRIHRRLTELVREDRVIVSGSRKCTHTGRRAQTYRIAPARQPGQQTLF